MRFFCTLAAFFCRILDAKQVPLDTTDVQALVDAGIRSAHQQQYAEAEAYYTRALTLLPDNPDILLNLGLAYFKMKT